MIWAVYPYLVVVLHSSKSLKRLSDLIRPDTDCWAVVVCELSVAL